MFDEGLETYESGLEQLGSMQGSADASFATTLSDPGVATGISRGDDIGVGFLDVARFSVKELTRHAGLHHVVDSRASTTDHGFFEFDKLDSGDSCNELAGLGCDSLSVREVTGVVVCDSFACEIGVGAEELGEVFGEQELG